jgi:WD40 repeat protein
MSDSINNSAMTETSKRKIPLWVFLIFFVALLIAFGSFGMSKYQQRENQLGQIQQSKVAELKQSLLQQNDVINTNWFRTLNPLIKEVQGSLLWSSQEQQGIIELFNLPTLKENQQYHLWIYDLNLESSHPISALIFKPETKQLALAFKSESKISIPLKFELMLEEEGVEGGLSLLLAQP